MHKPWPPNAAFSREASFFALVIGAGPAGSTAARELTRAGLGPVALLDRATFPRLKPCAGGLSLSTLRVLDKLGLLEKVRSQANAISGALLQAPSGLTVRFEGGQGTLVLPRDRLDALLVAEAEALGVELHSGVRVTQVTPAANHHLEVTDAAGGSWRARWVVVASGAASALGGSPLPAGALQTMTGWYTGVEHDPGVVEMYFDRDLAPHYGWLFPEGEGKVNIGICLKASQRQGRPLSEVFEAFRDVHFAHRMRRAEPLRPTRGFPIATSGTIPTPAVPSGVLVVGEAARLANPISGEGIYHALVSGGLAARAIRRGLDRGWSGAQVSRWYLDALRLRLGPGLFLADRLASIAPPAMDAAALIGQIPAFRAALGRILGSF